MRRVLVIGPGGCGKSTFARALAECTGLPLIHLDALFWNPGWVPTADSDWDRTIERLIAQERWILDGNYGRTLTTRLAACDTVFFLDLHPFLCLWRVARRSRAYRGRSRPDLAADCPERLTWEFIWWILSYRRRRRPGILRQLAALPSGKKAFIFRSRGQVRRYLASLQQQYGV